MSRRTESGLGDLASLRPDSPVLAEVAAAWRSAYIHIPFCLRRCPYCDFAIVDESIDGRDQVERYVDALIAEIAMQDVFGPVDAVNFGGGTPTRLPISDIGRIVDVVVDRFGLSEGAELSLEANPEDWTPAIARDLVRIGFTRVSIGAQSFDDEVLRALGRAHVASDIARTVDDARDAGFLSVSVDLIFGHPTESNQSWDATVDRALGLEPDHISTYSLTVEAGTVLDSEVKAGATAPDDDDQADRYDAFIEASSARGIHRYEVSNHASVGHVCRYNLATWANAEYVAFGMGAHDHVKRVRSRNFRTMDRYLSAVESGERPRTGSETLDEKASDRDRLMLGLRLAAGVKNIGMARKFVESSAGEMLLAAGVLEVQDDRVVVVKPMLTDAVIREALSVSADDC
jgi:putative oxygen-independent coproporphyrinogen III oxidase